MQHVNSQLEELQRKLQAKRDELSQKHPNGIIPDDDPEPCGTCGGSGSLLVRQLDPENYAMETHLMPCHVCGVGEEVATRTITRVLRESGMEPYVSNTFETSPPLPGQEMAWAAIEEYALNPEGWLVLVGQPYVGKTRAAYCVANEWISLGKTVLFRSAPQLLDELRSGMGQDSKQYYEALHAVKTVSCLVLDDYGQQIDTPWVREKLYDITDSRMEQELPTVVTTNLDAQDWEARYARLWRRLADTTRCTIIQFTNPPVER